MAQRINRIHEPGESEFVHGKGLLASPAQRGQYIDPIDPEGPWELNVYDQAKAIQRTNPADSNAVADYAAKPGTPANYYGNQEWTRED